MICYHDKNYNSIVHIPILVNVLTSFSYVNKYSTSMWIQEFSISPIGGNPIIILLIAGKYWTSTGNNAALPFTLHDPYTFAANNENEEIELPANASIQLSYASNSPSGATVDLNIIMAMGV